MSLGPGTQFCPSWSNLNVDTTLKYKQVDDGICQQYGATPNGTNNTCFMASGNNMLKIVAYSDTLDNFKRQFYATEVLHETNPANFSQSLGSCVYPFAGTQTIPPAVGILAPNYGFPINPQ